MKNLTTTSYAMLGLLARKPCTAYELTKQMERALGGVWPRAQSKLYEEPQALVARGMAKAKQEFTGNRPRVVYSITQRGRVALSDWLGTPGAGPVLEFEALLKVFFADQGNQDSLLNQISAMKAWAVATMRSEREAALDYLKESEQAPGRLPMIGLMSGFLLNYAEVVSTWADWAAKEVASWPGVGVMAPNKKILAGLLDRTSGGPTSHRTASGGVASSS